MQIELYLVPPGNRDFRKALIEKATEGLKGPDFSNILYLAPTRQLVRSWQRDFHPFGGGCYIPPRAYTHWQLSRTLYAGHSGSLLLNKKLVPIALAGLTGQGMGYATIVSDFIRDMKNHFPGEDAESLGRRLKEIFTDLDVPEEVSKRAFDALDVFARYHEALAAAGAADEEDALTQAASIIGRQSGPEVLILDGFYELTPAEEMFVTALIGRARKTLISIPISDANDDLSHCYSRSITEHFGVEPVMLPSPGEPELEYVASQSREDELEGIARHIKSRYVSGKLRELDRVYVAFPKPSEYRATLSRVFRRYGIPFSPEPDSTRHFRDILNLLEAVGEGFPRLATARFLTSPFFRGIPEGIRQAVPKIALEAGAITGKDSWLRALQAYGLKTEGKEIFKKIAALTIASNLSSYAIFIDVVLDLLKKLEFTPEGEEPEGYEGVLKGLGVIDSIPGARPSGLQSLTEALGSYLDIGGTRDEEVPGVHVAPLRELRGLDPEYLYMGGLKDGDIPARPEMDFLLPDSVRARLGLVDVHRYLRLQGYIFRRLVSTAGHLRLSFPSMEGDKLFLPSLFLRGGRETSENIFGDFSPEEALTRRSGEPFSASIREIKGLKRRQSSSPMNVTDIDAYRACPRRFFIEKVMGLEPPDIREYELEPKTIGSVVHEVMEKLIGPSLGGFEAFARRAERALDSVLQKWPLDDYFRALIKESFLTVLPQIYELEEALASEGYRPELAEYRVMGEPLPGIKLKGKIDRVDLKDGGAALVLDYKTGAAELSSTSALKQGANLQPFIYAAMLKAEGFSPESVGIYSLKDVKITRVPRNKDLKEGRALDHFIESALLYLDSTVSAMRDGDFRAHPLSDGNCRRCHERPYCPYIQGDAK